MQINKSSVLQKIFNVIFDILIVIFGIILLISIYNFIQVKLLGNDHSSFFGYSVFEVQTGSMADTINIGDWIIVKKTDKIELKDIVTYKQGNDFVTHRVIEAYNKTYITKGDANNAKDKPINKDQILGKTVKILSGFGILKKTLFNPGVLFALIIFFYFLGSLFKKSDNENDKNQVFDKFKNLYSEIIKKIKEPKEKKPISIKVENKKEIVKTEVETEKEEISSEEVSNCLEFFNNDNYSEEDLNKTQCFRVIPVNLKEMDETLLEIAENEINEAKKNDNDKIVEEEVTAQEEEPQDDALTKINLELMMNNKNIRKSKNIIDRIMIIKEGELKELINILLEKEKVLVNEPTIKEIFLNVYIDFKYYNGCNNYINKYCSVKPNKIKDTIKEVSDNLINNYKYKDKKYIDKVVKFANIFMLISNLEDVKNSITTLKSKKEFYRKKLSSHSKNRGWETSKTTEVINGIIKVQKNYGAMIEYTLRKLDTTMFNLEFNELKTKKNLFALSLNHNISFSKVYSDYIVDKTYTEGIVAEDKMEVLLTLLQVQLVKDMSAGNFNKTYMLYIPETLYSKESKLAKLLRMISDEYAKNKVIILLGYEDLVKNKLIISKIRKENYLFGTIFTGNEELKAKDRGNLYINEYFFVSKNLDDKEKIISFIPDDIKNEVIEENIIEKISDFGGE